MIHSLLIPLVLLMINLPIMGEEGLLDLRDRDLSTETVKLEGDWEFYWEQLLYPEEKVPEEKDIMTIPIMWDHNKKYTNHGFGTYRINLLLPEVEQQLAMFIPYSLNHYRIYINDQLWQNV